MPDVTIYTAPYDEDMRHSRTLLAAAVRSHTGRDPGEARCDAMGKPFFPALPELFFSVSHSGGWWLCAVSDDRVGLDLQIHRTYLPPATLSRRFFHLREDDFLSRDGYRRFFDLWCAKESFVKYTGRGFRDEPHTFSVVSEDGSFPASPGCAFRILPFREGYSLCLCTPGSVTVHFTSLPDLPTKK